LVIVELHGDVLCTRETCRRNRICCCMEFEQFESITTQQFNIRDTQTLTGFCFLSRRRYTVNGVKMLQYATSVSVSCNILVGSHCCCCCCCCIGPISRAIFRYRLLRHRQTNSCDYLRQSSSVKLSNKRHTHTSVIIQSHKAFVAEYKQLHG